MTTIIGLIISLCKAVPIVNEWVQSLIDSYIDEKIKSIEMNSISREDKKRVLLSKISEAKTNEEKCALFSAYNDICKL